MGMFTSLFKERVCARCKGKFLCEFQFKFGQDLCDQFHDGDLVPDGYPKKATYKASFGTFCDICSSFVNREKRAMEAAGVDLLKNLGYEIRSVRSFDHVFKNGKRVCELFGSSMITRGGRITPEFQRAEKAITDLWNRQIAAANLKGVLVIKREWIRSFGLNGENNYHVRIAQDNQFKDATVHLGKQFRLVVGK